MSCALDGLREKRLAALYHGAESRVPKYKHNLLEARLLTPAELALVCVLLLRGPQTLGELRTRTERLHKFPALLEVEESLEALARQNPPLVVKLPRQFGLKEARYAHLLSGSVNLGEGASSPLEPATLEVRDENSRLAKLEEESAQMRREIDELKQTIASLRELWE